MLQRFHPYRPITIFVLMLSYVWIIFQYPIQEALHIIIHSPDIQQEEFSFHSHEINDPGHFHRNLLLLEEIADANNAEESPQADLEIKKKIEIIDISSPPLSTAAWPKLMVEQSYLSFPSPFQNVIKPPPQLA